MGPDVGSPGVTQRASDISQAQLTGEAAALFARKRADASEQLRRDKIRQEREKKRRESERQAETRPDGKSDDGESVLDVVV